MLLSEREKALTSDENYGTMSARKIGGRCKLAIHLASPLRDLKSFRLDEEKDSSVLLV